MEIGPDLFEIASPISLSSFHGEGWSMRKPFRAENLFGIADAFRQVGRHHGQAANLHSPHQHLPRLDAMQVATNYCLGWVSWCRFFTCRWGSIDCRQHTWIACRQATGPDPCGRAAYSPIPATSWSIRRSTRVKWRS